jgi:hypothetical protein
VAAFALYWGQIEFFHAFGLFLIFTIAFALLFSLVFFNVASMILGATGGGCLATTLDGASMCLPRLPTGGGCSMNRPGPAPGPCMLGP